MWRRFLLAKIHGATVTGARLDYVGSLTVDPDLLEAAGMLPGEAVDVLNLHNGARLTTYLIEGRRGSGEVVANGAAARHIMPGDRVILLTYGLVPEEAAARHRPRIVTVGEGNRILTVEGQRR